MLCRDSKRLSPKQALFVRHYLADPKLNATKAAIAAGYSQKTAAVIGSENLKKPNIAAEIAKQTEKVAGKLEITRERVLRELALMGFANMMDYMSITDDGEALLDFSDLSRDQAAAIQEITTDTYTEPDPANEKERRVVKKIKFKLSDKRGSLELLGKHLNLFTDKPVDSSDRLDEVVAAIHGEPAVKP